MFTRTLIAACALCTLASAGHAQTVDHSHMDHAAHMADMARQAQARREAAVAERSKSVMPFSLAATTHVFTKDDRGGVQRVVARNAADSAQVALVREHLKAIRGQFLMGDFSGPSHIHGPDMPGLAELAAARPGQIAITFQEVPAGAELRYVSPDARLVAALHRWFDAQLSDHGKDAMAGVR